MDSQIKIYSPRPRRDMRVMAFPSPSTLSRSWNGCNDIEINNNKTETIQIFEKYLNDFKLEIKQQKEKESAHSEIFSILKLNVEEIHL